MCYDDAANALVMEALAIRDSVRLACDLVLTNVVVESDAQQLVRLWDAMHFDRAEVAPILNEVKFFTENFSSFRLVFVAREAN